jgi:molybdopterin molybdotransferase
MLNKLSVEEAVKTILGHINVLEAEEVPLLDSLGRAAADEIRVEINVPPWDTSAVDGYALKAADTHSANPQNPLILRVVETVRAGTLAKHGITSGTATRIMTGAPLPEGADSVVKFEDTDWEYRSRANSENASREIGIERETERGENVRRAGENVPRGSQIIYKGQPVGPAEINLVASQGHTRINVIRRPVVAIVATGEELTMPENTLTRPRIFNGNSYSIAAQVVRCRGIPEILGIARDNKTSLRAKIRRGLSADMILTSGGVSKGDYDLVKNIMAELGEIVFWQVKMTPGGPFAFALLHQTGPDGVVREVPHLALTGNPTAGMVNFELLARPAILKMAGRTTWSPKTVEAIMEDRVNNKPGNIRYVWVKLDKRSDGYYARATDALIKGSLPSVAIADGLAVIPEETAQVNPGEKLTVLLLDWK